MSENRSGDEVVDLDCRKRKTVDQSGSSSANAEQESCKRPKRRCTVTRKTVYSDQEEEDPDCDDKQPMVQKIVQKGTTGLGQQRGKCYPVTEKSLADFKWMKLDKHTGKIKCNLCLAAGKVKWFVRAGNDSAVLSELLRRHEEAEEHEESLQEAAAKKQNEPKSAFSQMNESLLPQAPSHCSSVPLYENTTSKAVIKDVFCIPMECVDPIPLPSTQLRNLLQRHGLKSKVKFSQDLTPSQLRADISKAFGKTFKLRTQELLQFDYLALSPDKTKLTKPRGMLHFDASTILSFVGDSDLYILLKQKAPAAQNVDWKELLLQQDRLNSLGDIEYKAVMMSVMYRLSAGKHEDDASEEQKRLVESLIGQYKLNSLHQLVYTGNNFDQLVMFVDKRRHEAFKIAHGPDHFDLQATFRNLFRLYYWSDMEQWVTNQIRNCSGCLEKYGEDALKAQVVSMENVGKESEGRIFMELLQLANPSLSTAPPFAEASPLQVKNIKDDKIIDFNGEGDKDETRKRARCAGSMRSMYLLLQDGKFCDFEIVLVSRGEGGDTTYNVHRVVLAMVSRKIAEMSASRIKLSGKVTSKSVERVIEFAYTGGVKGVRALPREQIERIGSTAKALDVRMEEYLREVRPDFSTSVAKIRVVRKFVAKDANARTAEDSNGCR